MDIGNEVEGGLKGGTRAAARLPRSEVKKDDKGLRDPSYGRTQPSYCVG